MNSKEDDDISVTQMIKLVNEALAKDVVDSRMWRLKQRNKKNLYTVDLIGGGGPFFSFFRVEVGDECTSH